MTSLLIESCERKNLIEYLKIITCIRQCVTSTDNIIDFEDKGVIFIDNTKNTVVKNILTLMISQNLLEESSINLIGDNSISKELLNTIYQIANSESKRDREQYLVYPSSNYIKDIIHNGIGGKLLEVALVAPELVEPSEKLEAFKKGIFKIGMALQALDDLCDIKEDIKEGKINYAVAKLLEDKWSIESLYTNIHKIKESFYKEYLDEVLKEAYKGFDCLIENGFPLQKKDVKFLLRHLFKIRGLNELWEKSSLVIK